MRKNKKRYLSFKLLLVIVTAIVFLGGGDQKAEAAIVFDVASHSTTGAGQAASLTWSHTVTGSDTILIVGAVIGSTSALITGVTYNGVAMTEVGNAINGSAHVYMFRLVNPTTGAHDVVVSADTSKPLSAGAASYTGVHQTTPLGTAVTANGSSTAPSVTVTSATGELVVDSVSHQDDAISLTVNASQTERYRDENAGSVRDVRVAGSEETGASSVVMSWTLGSTASWSIVGVPLKPAPTFTQSAYRLFNNANSTDVGSALAAQDTAATLGATGAAFRLRMLLHVADAELAISGKNFKLQFATQSGTCDTAFSGESYADVTASTVIAYNNNATPADGDNLTSNANDPTHSSDTIVNQDYEELNNFTNTVAAIPAGQDGKWDFSLIDNGATASTAYCFRAVKSDATVLTTYSVIPQITTAAGGQTLTFSINDTAVGFGNLSASAACYASPTPACSATEIEAHTLTVATNATSGFSLTVNGATLASGANTINAIGATSTASSAGTEQFGLRMNVTSGPGSVSSPYATASQFALDTAAFPDQIGSCASSCSTSTVYSVRYLGNITSVTESGSYSATLTFIATGTF